MASGNVRISFDTEANAVYYHLAKGKVVKSEKARFNGLDYVMDYDAQGELIGVEVLNMKKALSLVAGESSLLLAPLREKMLPKSH